MKSVLAGLRNLVLPWGARPGTPRMVEGPDIPTELKNFSPDYTWHAVKIWYFDATNYYFEALVTNTAFDIRQHMTGVNMGGTIRLYEFHANSGLNINFGTDNYNGSDRIAMSFRQMDLMVSGTATLNAEDPVLDDGTIETPKPIALMNGWTGTLTVERVVTPKNCVYMTGQLTPSATKANGTQIGLLPVAYRPSAGRAMSADIDVTVAGGQSPHLDLPASGAINVWGCSSAAVVFISGLYRQ